MASRRQEKIAGVIQAAISEIIQREMKDPRLGFVTVTGVDVSPDLRNAQVFVSVLGDDNTRRESLRSLQRATGFIRSELGRRAVLRLLPELAFEQDTSVQTGARITELLGAIKQEEPSTRDTE